MEYKMPFTYYPFAQKEMMFAQVKENNKFKIPFIPLDEVFLRVSDFRPTVNDYFWVSSYGRVYNANTGMITNCHLDHAGYVKTSLARDRSKFTKEELAVRHTEQVFMHGLVCTAFHGPRPEGKQVNHLDCCRCHNYYKNLEWVTPKENTQYAYDVGFREVGENIPYSILTNQEVHEICRLIELGYSNIDIEMIMYGTYNSEKYSIIAGIRNGASWKHISCNYNMPKSQFGRKNISEELVHRVCQYFQSNNAFILQNATEILNGIGIDVKLLDQETKEIYKSVVNGLKYKSSYAHISSQYNFMTVSEYKNQMSK